ncbi:MAG: hypothetical protein KAT34_13230 [Candidatus Aminicenantes bacterium]|nr:hypothetical protein [Candidatus Aminicenantes bacterium]
MSNLNIKTSMKPEIPEEIVLKWQGILDLMCRILGVYARFVKKVEPPRIEVFIASATESNPLDKEVRADSDTGLYNVQMIKQRGLLPVPDELKDLDWEHKTEIEMGMNNYVRFPLEWPDGEIFGTIYVLEVKDNQNTSDYKDLLSGFKEIVERDLRFILDSAEREELVAELQHQIKQFKQIIGEQATELERLNKEHLKEITERKKSEQALRYAQDELEQRVKERTACLEAANRELEAFSYSISHDLRAPLRAINGFSQALLEDYSNKMDSEGKDYLRRICAGANRMDLLINEILKLSRLSRAELNIKNLDISALARIVSIELQKKERKRKVEFKIISGLRAVGDSKLLRVVLENLLGNAWKFTAKKKHAVIEFASKEEPDKDSGQTVYYVRDNGIGFDMTQAGKMFIAFHRLHNEKEFPGTGIGLATVQRIINRHEGRIWAEGKVNEGAVFYFTLGKIC